MLKKKFLFASMLCLLTLPAWGESRLVHWQEVKGAQYYNGNLYLNGKITRFRIMKNRIYVDQDAIVEVYAILGPGQFQPALVSRPGSPKGTKGSPNGGSQDAPPSAFPAEEDVYENTQQDESQAPDLQASSADVFEAAPLNPKTSEGAAEIWEFEGNLGAYITQDQLSSSGVLGRFKGHGVTTAAELTTTFFPKSRATTPVYFILDARFGRFVTKSSEKIGDVTQTHSNSNAIARLKGGALSYLLREPAQSLSLGLGASWERLPFFDTVDESVGKGELTTRTSIGLVFLANYSHTLAAFGRLILDFSLIPIGANTDSVQQLDFSTTFETPIAKGLTAYVSGHFRNQKIRFSHECSSQGGTCVYPKTTESSYGLALGLGLSL